MNTLARVVGLKGAVLLGLGSILGTGVFVSLGLATGIIGSGVVVAVFLAALVATANGLSSAQLAAAHPVSGGTYEYGHRFLNPVAGFTAGWMFLAAKSASAATAALGCAGYLLHLFRVDDVVARVVVALLIVAVTTVLVVTGIRRSNYANIAIVSVTIVALMAFVLSGVLSLDVEVGSENFRKLTSIADTPASLLHATALMFVAYTGYGRIATLGEEVREPAATIPKAIIATLAVSMLLYVSVCATAIAVVGADVFAAATMEAAAPLEVVARSFRHPQVAWLIAIGAVTAMAGVLLNLLLGLSRVLLAMARRHEMPFRFTHVDTRTQSPTQAVIAIGFLVGLLVLTGDIKTTWSFSAFSVLVYYGITNLAALELPEESRRFPRAVSWFGLFACSGLAVFVEPLIWSAGIAVIFAGFGVRFVMKKISPADTGDL